MRRQVRNALIAVLLVAGIAASIATAVRQFAGGAQAPAQAAAASLFSGNAGSRMQASPPPVNGMTTAPDVSAPGHEKKVEQRPLPAAGTPLKEIQDQLAARAADGDAAAASRLFRDTQACLAAHQQRKFMASSPRWPPDDMLDEAQRELDRMRSFDALCAGMDAELEDGRIYAISLRSAELGDELAACFYLNAPLLVDDGRLSNVLSDVVDPSIPPPIMRLDANIVAQYQASAIRVATAGVERGDWNMVEALMQIYGGGGNIVTNPLPADPVWRYRYHLLWRMGEADPEVLQRYEEVPLEMDGLTEQEIAAARAWANTTYRQYFAQRPIMPSSGYGMCSIPPLQGLN